jgi:hypothetical protein
MKLPRNETMRVQQSRGMEDHDIVIVPVADAEQVRHDGVACATEHERLFDGFHRDLRILQKKRRQ